MLETDLSIELEKIEYQKREEILKKQSSEQFKENMKRLEKRREDLINSLL